MQVNQTSPQTFTVTEDDINSVLGDANGVVSNAHEYVAVLRSVTAGTGIKFNSATYADGTEYVDITLDKAVYPEEGSNSSIKVYAVGGNETLFDLVEVDITDNTIDIDSYIHGLEKMLRKTISAASKMGALHARVDMQAAFVLKLSESIDKGVGRLVDAEMDEASTRLKALQTQKQLAIQSLSIVNTKNEGMLSLFQ